MATRGSTKYQLDKELEGKPQGAASPEYTASVVVWWVVYRHREIPSVPNGHLAVRIYEPEPIEMGSIVGENSSRKIDIIC